jgi:hypothetical protein
MPLDKTQHQNSGKMELGNSFITWYAINGQYLVSANIRILQKEYKSQASFIITNSSLYFVY